MSTREQLSECVGEWEGAYRLWVVPGDPVRVSKTAASVALVAGEGFVAITYDWEEGGKPQDGLLIVRIAAEPADEEMVWIDSWHTGGKLRPRGEALR